MKVYSIFKSINGEICNAHQGSTCTFIRLAGCSVGCSFCDTEYAACSDSGEEMSVADILSKVIDLRCWNITITGGEPLEQMVQVLELVRSLKYVGCNVSIETSGEVFFDRFRFPEYVSMVTDIKLEKKRESIHYINMHLNSRDFFKVVIGSRQDFLDAIAMKARIQAMGCTAKFAFSPKSGEFSPKALLTLMQHHDQNDVILNVQLHKILELKEDS